MQTHHQKSNEPLSLQIQKIVAPYNMLNHPFYQRWLKGELSKEELQYYAIQYKPFVDDFPRFVSRIHSQCKDKIASRLLLQNLWDEEGFPDLDDHPTLWKFFANGIETNMNHFENGPFNTESQQLQNIFWNKCDSSYAEGLSALYCYEHQIPAIAEAKIKGLKQFYGISDSKTHLFFSVHQEADKEHSQACETLLNRLPEVDQPKALESAQQCAHSLWNFLSSCELQ